MLNIESFVSIEDTSSLSAGKAKMPETALIAVSGLERLTSTVSAEPMTAEGAEGVSENVEAANADETTNTEAKTIPVGIALSKRLWLRLIIFISSVIVP